MKLLLDEMYPAALAGALTRVGVSASSAREVGLGGSSDPEIFAAAVAGGFALLTENTADFARIAAEHLAAGRHHRGVLIALSSRFSRGPAGIPRLTGAIREIADEPLEDRVVYLTAPTLSRRRGTLPEAP